jgi:ribosomal protein S27AE
MIGVKDGTCPRCGGTKVMPDLRVKDTGRECTGVTVYVTSQKPSMFASDHGYDLRAWACGDCGFTELYLAEPTELWERYTKGER